MKRIKNKIGSIICCIKTSLYFIIIKKVKLYI